jgi:hypothetical protein
MRKTQWYAVLYTLMLAVPFTVIALCALIYLTDYTAGPAGAITSFVDWDQVAVQGSARWPELAGMVAGQLAILGILLIARRDRQHDNDSLVDIAERTRALAARPLLGYKPPPSRS